MTLPIDQLDVASVERGLFYFFLRRVFHQLHGRDLPHSDYIEALALALQRAQTRRAGRLLVTMPPRHLKSIAGSVALPAFVLGHNPRAKIMVATYGEDLGRQHASQFARIIRSPWYRDLFPEMQVESCSATLLKTTAGGARYSVTLGGAVTGLGADLIIMDDLVKAQEAHSQHARQQAREYYTSALLTRLNNQNEGSIIALMQRLSEDDLPAFLVERCGYRHLNLPAIAETDERIALHKGRTWHRRRGDILDTHRFSRERLQRMEQEMGRVAFAAQYQQNPVPPEGAAIDIRRLSFSADVPGRGDCWKCVQSWDTAVKAGPDNDWSVCSTWGFRDGVWYLLDIMRDRLEFPDLKGRMITMKARWRADKVLIEEANAAHALFSQLRDEGHYDYLLMRPGMGKEERLCAQLDWLQSDRIVFPSEAPWRDTLIAEMRAFPNGRHDDQVDSIAQFIEWIRSRPGQGYMDINPETGRPMGRNRPVTCPARHRDPSRKTLLPGGPEMGSGAKGRRSFR